MRRALVSLLAVPALALGACTGDDAAPTVGTDPGPTTAAPAQPEDVTATSTAGPDEVAATTGTDDGVGATAPPADDATATTAAAPTSTTTTAQDDPADVMSGAEGQAAADRAEQFLHALVAADPEACSMVLSLSDPERPMTDVPSDLEMCRTQLPATMAATVEAQGLGEEGVAVLEEMEIRGADVQGDTAVTGPDNYSAQLEEAMGEATITLRRIDDAWYVDLDAFLATG